MKLRHARSPRGPDPDGVLTADFGWHAVNDSRVFQQDRSRDGATRYLGRLVDAKGYGFALLIERCRPTDSWHKGWRWEIRRATPTDPRGGIVAKSRDAGNHVSNASENRWRVMKEAQDAALYRLRMAWWRDHRAAAARAKKATRKAQKAARRRNR